MAGARVGGGIAQGGAIAGRGITQVGQVEAKVNGPVGVGVIVAIHGWCTIWLCTDGEGDHTAGDHAIRQAQTVVVVIDIRVRIRRRRVAGAIAKQGTSEVSVADDDDIAAFGQRGEGVIAAADRVAKGNKAINAGGKVTTTVAVAVEFNTHAGNTIFAAVDRAIVIDIIPDPIA